MVRHVDSAPGVRRRNPSLRTHPFARTDAFGRFSRMLVCPVPEPTHGVSLRDTTSNAQCALRDSLGISGRGFPPRRRFHGMHSPCLRMPKGRARPCRARARAGGKAGPLRPWGGDFPVRMNRSQAAIPCDSRVRMTATMLRVAVSIKSDGFARSFSNLRHYTVYEYQSSGIFEYNINNMCHR